MIIEIRMAGFVNKGAELMLIAALEKMRAKYPQAIFTMAPTPVHGDQPFHKIVKLGFFPKAWLWSSGVQVGDFAGLLPEKFRQRFGLILDKEIDVVLDAAGFAYGDQWSDHATRELARSSSRWQRRGTVLVLLPQALGPFRTPKMRKHIKSIVKNADLVFAREEESYRNLYEVVGEQDKIRIAPDFTNLLKGRLPSDFNRQANRVCLVPNARMIDKLSKSDSAKYVPFMKKCLAYLKRRNARPFVLVHEGKQDLSLARKIIGKERDVNLIQVDDAVVIKGILGSCYATIGSRYHGLVSALSQGVPSLAIGWSYKYEHLFSDYGIQDCVLSISEDDKELFKKIDMLLDAEKRADMCAALTAKSAETKFASEEMWNIVFKTINDAMNRRCDLKRD